MRKAGIAVLTIVLAGLGAGLWLGMRRQPAGALLEEPAAAFTLEAAAPGQLARFVATQIALRALRWLPPRQDGVLVVQAQTQSDRQLLALFRAGAAPVEIPVARPQGVGEGFWRFAVLQDALVGPDGILLLLFRPGDPGSAESSLAMALDPGALEARWVHRGAYDRMALGGEPDPAVFLFGGKGPVQRLALGGTVRRPAAKDIELPAEVPEVEDLLPTGAGSFLVASRNGLSAFQGAKGWSHFPPPAEQGVPCANARGVLTRAGKRIWWQPAPGLLVQVGPDGATVADREVPFPAEDPQARDARLLKLLGADAAGRLWFGLATPAPAVPPPAGSGLVAPAQDDWAAYAAQGLDRIYRWNPDRESLERLAWSEAWPALNPPAGLAAGVPALRPQAGSVLLEGTRAGWWLPLSALPFRALAQAR